MAAGLTLSLKSYADQENAATGLKVAMMDANGEVGKSFQDINKLAIGLGNQLPGTTADFQNMMQMLVRQGIPAENILGGVGKATAYLAVQLKKTPEAAAEFAAKMQDATGTVSEDMMGLFDTIQKAFYLGVDDTNMLSFFTKTSSVLKMVNKDGLQAAQSLAPISVMMDQMGMNGESAGNALRKVIQSGLSVKKIRDVNKVMARQKLGVQLDFTDGKGSFGGLDNMFRQLAKLRKLTDVKRTGVLKAIFGDDAETLQVVNALIDKGKDGYDQIQQKMNKQASLNKRVQAQLGTLPGITRAWTYRHWMGTGTVGVMIASSDLINPIPEESTETAARQHIEPLAPVAGSDLYVFRPVAHTVDFHIRVTPDTPEIRAAITAELRSFLLRDGYPQGELKVSRISEAISGANGEYSHQLLAPADNISIAKNELAVLGTISWT
ncbi:phage tail tape measure protein [Escherichia coli]|nr:phage tail tape measure protein [Escherichia coli]